MFTGWKSQVLVIKYPRCFDCRQIVSVGEQLMQVFRISKQGSWGLHIHLGYCALSLGVCCQKFWDCMVISPSRVKCSVKKWISLDIWAFKLRPLSILEMLSSKHIVAECNAAEWWIPPVLTYVLEELATSIFRVVQEDPPSLRWYKKEYFWASLKIEAASSSKLANVYHWTLCHVRKLESLSALRRNLVSFYLYKFRTFILNLSIPKSHLEIWKFANCNWNLLFHT